MNYCKHLKKRKNKPFCKLLNREITLSECKKCKDKEYKTKTRKNSFYKNDIKISNNNQIKKKTGFSKKSPVKSGKLKNKSNKLAKLERNRKSVFTDDKDKCMFCGATANLTWHEIYAGRNRKNSMEDGLCLRMCLSCHNTKQEDIQFNEFWHREAQLYYERHIGSKEEFLARYRRNYLK